MPAENHRTEAGGANAVAAMPHHAVDPITISAYDYVARGWSLVRLPSGQKAPRGRNWQKTAINAADAVERHFRGPTNIGVLLGTASGGLVDIDLDCPEACALADKILPPAAAVFGRASKPRSHRLYRVEGCAPSLQFEDPYTGDMLVELRGDKQDGSAGLQTVFPPSIHPSGEVIEWAEEGEPARVDYAELKEAATHLAIRCLITLYCLAAVSTAEAWATLNRIDPRLGNEIRRWIGNSAQKAPTRGNGADAPATLASAAANIYDPPAFSEDGLSWVWTALSFIDSLNRDTWLRVGAALHDITSWAEEVRRAMFDLWSVQMDLGEPKKFDPVTQEATWESFNRPYEGQRATVGTIIHLGKESGWAGRTLIPLPEELRCLLPFLSPRHVAHLPPSRIAGPPHDLDEAQMASPASTPLNPQPIDIELANLKWYGEEDNPDATPRWLIKGLFPETGTGLLSGQWGSGKTFVALDLGVSIILGEAFANQICKRPGGVLYIAAEGGSQIPIRARAILKEKHPLHRGPPALGWLDYCPPFVPNAGRIGLVQVAQAVGEWMHEKFGKPLVLIIVDTLAAAFNWKDEISSAEGQQAMNVLSDASRVTGAFVLAVDHFGKVVETGTRGTSAKEAAADAVIACLAERANSGTISNTRIAVRKLRAGATGG